MRAPINSTSTVATKSAECRALAYATTVAIVHAIPSVETTNKTTIESGVRISLEVNRWTNHASIPIVGISVTISRSRQQMKRNPAKPIVTDAVLYRMRIEELSHMRRGWQKFCGCARVYATS